MPGKKERNKKKLGEKAEGPRLLDFYLFSISRLRGRIFCVGWPEKSVAHHGWATKKIFVSERSKVPIST